MNNQYSAFLFFFAFLIVGTWFFLNLFIGVIFTNFINAQKSAEHSSLSEDQRAWIDMQSQMLKAEITWNEAPAAFPRREIYFFVKGNIFERMVFACCLLCTLMLSLYYDNPSALYKSVLDTWSCLTTLFFILELIVKLICYTPRGYILNATMLYELMTTVVYVVHSMFIILDVEIQNLYSRRILGALRIMVVVRVVGYLKGIQNLILSIKLALPMIFNIVMLALVVFFCYAIFGCYLFSGVKKGLIIDEYNNFFNLINAMVALFRCSTSDDCNFLYLKPQLNLTQKKTGNPMMFDCAKFLPDCTVGVDCGSRKSFCLWLLSH